MFQVEPTTEEISSLKELKLPKMRFLFKLLLLFSLLFCIDFGWFQEEIDSENVYFPDQIEYIQLLRKYCKGDLIYWPDGRCYKVGEQGPCNIGRVLQIDRRYFKPFCTDPDFKKES